MNLSPTKPSRLSPKHSIPGEWTARYRLSQACLSGGDSIIHDGAHDVVPSRSPTPRHQDHRLAHELRHTKGLFLAVPCLSIPFSEDASSQLQLLSDSGHAFHHGQTARQTNRASTRFHRASFHGAPSVGSPAPPIVCGSFCVRAARRWTVRAMLPRQWLQGLRSMRMLGLVIQPIAMRLVLAELSLTVAWQPFTRRREVS